MSRDTTSWLLVEGGSPEEVQRAVVKHSTITRPEVPTRHRCRVFRLDAARLAVTFDPPAPPYAFTNLIGWLDDPRMNHGAKRAVGWLVSPGDGTRYYLAPKRANRGGDTLVGATANGRPVSVFLPSCSLRVGQGKVETETEPELPGGEPAAEFDVTFDSNPDFGNRTFVTGG
jgi:hypothetical protein